MSKKLLEEQAVRKFMKIAGLQPLTNSFLKENETVEEGYGKKKMEEESHKDEKEVKEEAAEKDGKKLEEVEELEEAKEELEEGGGQMPFDEASRRPDERAPEDRVNEAKALVAKASKMKGAPASQKMKPAKKAGGLVKEEEMPEEDMADVEAPEGDMEAAPEAPAAGGLDVEGLVKELIRVITEKVPGAADVISVEEEGGETEVEMGGDEAAPGHEAEEGEMEGGEEDALDEAALEKVVAETVKRVKARLMESKKPKATLTKEALAKKVAAKVAERLKKA
jgi:hypothetical protein